MCHGSNCQHENSFTGECEKPINDPYPCITTSADEWENPEELPDAEYSEAIDIKMEYFYD